MQRFDPGVVIQDEFFYVVREGVVVVLDVDELRISAVLTGVDGCSPDTAPGATSSRNGERKHHQSRHRPSVNCGARGV